jgi:hypothetical protein
MDAVDVFLVVRNRALCLKAENLWESEPKKTEAARVQKVPSAQAIAELDGAISI